MSVLVVAEVAFGAISFYWQVYPKLAKAQNPITLICGYLALMLVVFFASAGAAIFLANLASQKLLRRKRAFLSTVSTRNLLALANMLENQGYAVTSTGDPLLIKPLLRKGRFALALVDAALTTIFLDIPARRRPPFIFALTGRGDPESSKSLYTQALIDDTLARPPTPEALLELLVRHRLNGAQA